MHSGALVRQVALSSCDDTSLGEERPRAGCTATARMNLFTIKAILQTSTCPVDEEDYHRHGA